MADPQAWPPPPTNDTPQVPQKRQWSVSDWIGAVLAAAVFGSLTIYGIVLIVIVVTLGWACQHRNCL